MSILLAIQKLYAEMPGLEDVLNDIANDYITENTCHNGRKVLWYMDESHSAAIYLDTLELLTEDEIENELC